VSQKKTLPFYICDNSVRHHPILSILGRNIPLGIWNKQSCTQHITSQFYTYVLYLVKNQQRLLQHTIQHQIGPYTRHRTSLPHMWPPNPPNLNPVDYKLKSLGRHAGVGLLSVGDLKGCMTTAWSDLPQHVIGEATDQRHGRLCAWVRTEVWQFKHVFIYNINSRFTNTDNIT